MEPNVEIKHVLLYAALRPGSLMLAECADGCLRLFRDDRPLDGGRWEGHEVEQAAAAFHKMVAQLEWKGN